MRSSIIRHRPPIAQVANMVHTAVGLLSAGVGVATVQRSATRHKISKVKLRPLRGGEWAIDYGLAWRSGRLKVVQEAFHDTALAVSAGITGSNVAKFDFDNLPPLRRARAGAEKRRRRGNKTVGPCVIVRKQRTAP
jgi:hypothetical protein